MGSAANLMKGGIAHKDGFDITDPDMGCWFQDSNTSSMSPNGPLNRLRCITEWVDDDLNGNRRCETGVSPSCDDDVQEGEVTLWDGPSPAISIPRTPV